MSTIPEILSIAVSCSHIDFSVSLISRPHIRPIYGGNKTRALYKLWILFYHLAFSKQLPEMDVAISEGIAKILALRDLRGDFCVLWFLRTAELVFEMATQKLAALFLKAILHTWTQHFRLQTSSPLP
ncbi:hypothetical protein E1B28_000228 [Marasmius oreades]|uniref:Uncharacterized protein n=1 Tax=Marasmius oreades TaxID=181124 RepID=A0A9P7V104_9AGAR|nr:uncharacterized protein E1B28_000228 [Marasmius oreades]KAG7098266.1 hypothetical protein E1B28_000228 [Marasmius oreades]